MTTQHRNLVNHTFHGGRFEDGGIDIDTLPELLRYKDLLVEVAKELWKCNHPGRERLPKNFEDGLSVKFYEVRNNCATVPLERLLSIDDRERLLNEDELDEAVTLVAETIEAAGNDQPIPERFPKGLLRLFDDYGKSLHDDEWIEQRPPKKESGVRYDASVRERLTKWVEASYEDFVDVTGEVTMARVTKPRMAIQLEDGREIEAAVRPQDEADITTALKEHATARLRVVGRGQFGADGRIQRITTVDRIVLLPEGQAAYDISAKPIWDEFADVLSDIPREVLSRLPIDGAEQHDIYINGSVESEK